MSNPSRSLFGLALAVPLAAVMMTAGAGCTPGETEPDAGTPNQCLDTNSQTECRRNIDCGGGSICEKENEDDEIGCCLKIFCSSNDDCSENEICDLFRGICVPSNLCDPNNSAADCNDGEFCVYNEGTPQCVADGELPDVAECIITPSPLQVAHGGEAEVRAVGRDDSGALVANASFTFAATGVGSMNGAVLTADCTDASPCTGTVTATADRGGVTCSTAVTAFPAPGAADFRVSLFDQTSGDPISGATVMINIAGVKTTGTTAADGSYTFAAIGGTVDAVGAYPDTHQWQTVLDPTGNDIALYSVPIPDPSQVAGVKGQFDFSNVTTQGDIRLGLAGMSISSAITDLDFATLIGEIDDYNVVLEGVTDSDGEVVPLPSGLVIELANESIKGDFVVFGDEGTRILWALGGRVRLSDIGEIISGVTASDDVNVGSILASVLPFFSRFDHATVTGLDLENQNRPADPANDQPIPYGDWPFEELTGGAAPALNTLLSQDALYDVPTLPCVPGQGTAAAGCTDNAFNSGVVMLSGVVVPGLGLVPLGLTAGLDDPDDADGNDQRDGNIDHLPPDTGVPATDSGKVNLFYAPPHDGLEGNLLVTIGIALDIDGLTEGALGASTITHITTKYDETNSFPKAFLEHQGGTYDASAADKTFVLNSVGNADFYRLNLNNFADEGEPEPEWNIWFSGDPGTITISDLAPDGAALRDDDADIQAFSLGTGYAGQTPANFGELFSFNGTNLDNLLYYLGGWSSTSCDNDDAEVEGQPFCLRIP